MNAFQKLLLDIMVSLNMVYSLNGSLVYYDASGTRGIDDMPGTPDEVSPWLWGEIFMRAVYLNPSLLNAVIYDRPFEIQPSYIETFWNLVSDVANTRVVSQS